MNSGVFGDPCPNTHKYVEVHYACSPVGSQGGEGGPLGDHSTRKLPPWLLETGTHLWNNDPSNGGLVDPNTGIPIQIEQDDVTEDDDDDVTEVKREPPTLISEHGELGLSLNLAQ